MMNANWRGVLLAVLAAGLVLGTAGTAEETLIVYDVWTSGNAQAECCQLGCYGYSFKIDDWDEEPADGVHVADSYDADGNLVHTNAFVITVYYDPAEEPKSFAWVAHHPMSAVIVKAGRDDVVIVSILLDPRAEERVLRSAGGRGVGGLPVVFSA